MTNIYTIIVARIFTKTIQYAKIVFKKSINEV